MSMTREAKADAIADLSEKLSRAKGGIVASYIGLDVASVSVIRDRFREVKAEYRVVKNTLMKRALAGTALEPLGKVFQGPTAIAFKYDDELSELGKVVEKLEGDFEKFEVKAVYIDQDVVFENGAKTMASLPSLAEVQIKLLNLLKAPGNRLATVLEQPAKKVLRQINAPAEHVTGVLRAYQRKLEE